MSQQRALITDVLEGAPSLAFVIALRVFGEAEPAGWIGCVTALCVFAVFKYLDVRMNPVMLGVNVYMLLITPLLRGLFEYGGTFGDELAAALLPYTRESLLVSVFLTGLVLTLCRRSGFAGLPDTPQKGTLAVSLGMLCVSAFGILWAFSGSDNGIVAVIATISALIFIRRWAQARGRHHLKSSVVATAGAGALAAHTEPGAADAA
ncbi:hypothetical protein JM93_01017 [Roseibium hamelinense]|uniref:Uncharacterized protein n=1 Tax=Roseibium hamelinense TaxID=150831 RepID=A0A562T8X5_9HYPH|nr:hypothetical protein [Roseibium hamelinense]MTI45582.1 hypothetical protein [Roseibium hamelinense]TWI90041.1 hypothetical protein JM93_01017 [Roseibium hamelinense]